jgi:hypothetical protein
MDFSSSEFRIALTDIFGKRENILLNYGGAIGYVSEDLLTHHSLVAMFPIGKYFSIPLTIAWLMENVSDYPWRQRPAGSYNHTLLAGTGLVFKTEYFNIGVNVSYFNTNFDKFGHGIYLGLYGEIDPLKIPYMRAIFKGLDLFYGI